ncbi:leucine-rich repeat-containing protein 9-like [Schistocerca nitens]|uniref:leucine-rich repeat-containing protein 9-like n=1 Tax=Schistocerca nitens TaxID=7011 RepID=UPI0021179ADE|nr:leucine-rich repeat-containing protein 9-like [Schistocerca nitens]
MIDSLQGLEGLSDLIALVLDWNRITSVAREQVAAFSNLNELHLERNRISNLGFLKQLKQLQRLYLSYNKIHDFDQLKYVAALNHLEELTLIANPICPHHTAYHDLTAILPRFYIYIHSCDSDELPL